MLKYDALQWFKKWCKPARGESAQHAGSLYSLSGDLLFMICQYLTDAEAITLMHTCARFWNSREGTGVFVGRWQHMKSPIDTDLSKMTARFYVLRMLEYDGLLQRGSPSKYCCWGCMKVHEQSDFSSKEFKKKVALKTRQSYLPEEKARRSCSLERYLWFGGFRELSFTQLRHIIAHPDEQRRRDNGWIQLECNDDRYLFEDFPSLEGKARWITYGLPLARAQDITSYTLFERHASAVQIPLCPHLKMCDPKVIELYNDSSKLYHCEHCTTRVAIRTANHHIFVIVIRYLGLMRSPTDPVWLAQSYRARDKNLGPCCEKFFKWYRRQYGHIIFPRRFKSFRCKEKLLQPFEGVAFCPPIWPSAPYWDQRIQ